jgi:hypothetical protein
MQKANRRAGTDASTQPASNIPTGFLETVVTQLFDVRPAALVASLIQVGVALGIGKALSVACPYAPENLASFCQPAAFDFAAGALPTVVFWGLAIVLTWLLLSIIWTVWMLIPTLLCLGVVYASGLLPLPLSSIAAIGGVALVVWAWYALVGGKMGLEPNSGSRPKKELL